MIKIKDYIFNENEIEYIKSGTTFKENGTALLVETNGLNVKTKKKDLLFEDATFEDIEWNYGSNEKAQISLQNQLVKLQQEKEELEEENKKLIEQLLNYQIPPHNQKCYKTIPVEFTCTTITDGK